MNRAVLGLALTLMLIGLAACSSENHHMGPSDEPATTPYRGEIMDSVCAKAGSHDAMMREMGVSGPKDCTWACVKAGAKFVLFDPSDKAVYQLDDQRKASSFAGQQVTVMGSYDAASHTLHVITVEGSGGAKQGS